MKLGIGAYDDVEQPIIENLIREPGLKKVTTDADGRISHHYGNGYLILDC